MKAVTNLKTCINCSSSIDDNSQFCDVCGTEQPSRNRFCSSCGAKLGPDASSCPQCGRPISHGENPEPKHSVIVPPVIEALSNRIKINGIIWLLIGCFQLLFGLFLIVYSNLFVHYEYPNVFLSVIIYLLVGISNMIYSIGQIQYTKNISANFADIYRRSQFKGTTFLFYLYNIVIIIVGFTSFSALSFIFVLLGITGITSVTVIKIYVHKNKYKLINLERTYKKSKDKAAREDVPPADPISQYFRIYEDFTMEQLKEIVENPSEYEKDAYAVAKTLYERNFAGEGSTRK